MYINLKSSAFVLQRSFFDTLLKCFFSINFENLIFEIPVNFVKAV